MSPSEILLAVSASITCVLLAARRGGETRLWRVITISGFVIVAAELGIGTHRLAAVPMTVAGFAAATLAAFRSRRAPREVARRRGILRAVARWSAAVVAVTVVAMDAGFITVFDPLSNDPVRELLDETHSPDFSQLPWTDAFEKLHAHLARAYAMGEWKRIDWASLHDRTAAKIAAAARGNDRASFYLALREYLWSLPDGHVGLSGDDGGLRNRAIKGGFGFALLRLDDGRTIAHVVTEDGAAAKAGLRWGATVLSWNGVSIDDAATKTSVLWNGDPPATTEGLALARLKWLARAPVGTTVRLEYRNLDASIPLTVTLTAEDDQFAPIRAVVQSQNFSFRSDVVEWRVLPERVGYLKIRAELPSLSQPLPERVVRRAVRAFLKAEVRGVVIDARANFGGADKLVPLMMGWFVRERQFYEHAAFYDDRTGHFERKPSGTLWTEPKEPGFYGPIAVLVDPQCASSGEGLALIARRRPGGHVVGFYGTYGSFGMSGAEIRMPSGLTVEYPNGRSLDVHGDIQLDSDWRLEGGVTPDVRVPLTLETARAQFLERRDVVLQTAIGLLK
jgi:carboxyl-terminal processing protease